MAAKPSKSVRDSVDDVLGDLLGCDDEPPVKSARASQLARGSGGRAWGTSSQASKKSFLEDDFFSELPAKDVKAAKGSNSSDADLLKTLKDMDDMEADLLGMLKPSSGPGKTAVKGPGKCDSLGRAVESTGKLLAPEKRQPVPVVEKKLLTSPPASRQYKKFNFDDLDEPLSGQDAPKKPAPTDTKSISENKTEPSKEKEPPPPQTPLRTVAPVRKREDLTFEDDDDDLMDALGFGSGPKGDEKQGKKTEEEELRPARSKLDELLGRGSAAKILEQPGLGERKEFHLDKKYQKQPEQEESWDKEDFVFGAYQPTVAALCKGRPARRQSVRFLAEDSTEPKAEPQSKSHAPARQSPARRSSTGGDWLGLKDEDFMDSEPPSPVKAPAVSHPGPAAAGQPGPTSQPLATEEAAAKPNLLEEENWLSAALSRKKAQAQSKAQERKEAPSEGRDPCSPVSQPATPAAAPRQAAALQDQAASADGSRRPRPWLSTATPASAPPAEPARGDPLEPVKENPARDASTLVPAAAFPGKQETQGPARLAQVTAPRAQLQAAPQLQAESSALGVLAERTLGAPAAQLYEDASGCQAALLRAQTRVAELESQVRTLELERTQHKVLLESLQQRHQEDLDLLESAHRSQLKVVEESYGQREERLRREKEQLAAQLLSQSQDAEQARAELLAQHQQRLAALEQQNALELERLRELQRISVQEMRKDHEEQLQRLKRLKDLEIDAVTSATSHTRSLNGVIEQMEKFSNNLHDLSHKVEVTHHTTSQELAMGARQRDKELQVLQDRLSQQQRAMEEERSRLQEVIAKMEARLAEQAQLLEQERWRAVAEQSKVESLQHSLEEQRRVVTQQLSMERAELEKAKSALLEEQKSVMQKCSEERRKLAVEWAEFRTQQQLSKEQMERSMDRALQMDSQREGTMLSLAKEQAELKIWGRELKGKEEQLARDREQLQEAWQELRLEKEKVNRAALRTQQQEEEIKSITRLSSQKYEQGEQALREACRMESEHQTRLQVMQQHLEQLKQQEERLHKERLSMALQRRQLEQLREELPHNPMTPLTAGQDHGAPVKGLSRTLFPLTVATSHTQALAPGFLPPIGVLPRHGVGGSSETLATASPTELYAKLLLLKHRAQQDRDFLEDEQFFLETLKKSSYNTSPLSV
ncbi:fas-binding factor 1 isoform 2-T3 [Chlamydotis macqueenii]